MSATATTPRQARGIVLFAHGARDPAWAEPFAAMAALVRTAQPDAQVRLAFLELMPPDLHTVVSAMAADRITQIDVVPIFMAAGGHLKRDLPMLVEAARIAYPSVQIRLHPPVGDDPAVQNAIAAACIAKLAMA